MDGNRRWAENKGLVALVGHRQGYNKVKEVGKWCKAKGVKTLTLWAFSTENWNRPKNEVAYLMKLFERALSKKEISQLNKDGIKLKIIGQKERLSGLLQKLIKEAEETTKNNQKGTLVLAISYGGRAEILEAMQRIAEKNIPANKITEETIAENLWTAGLPYPDLIIRTSGEKRTSGFLMWQSAYSEFYFCKNYWPDFSEKDLDEALADYSQRQRRYGK